MFGGQDPLSQIDISSTADTNGSRTKVLQKRIVYNELLMYDLNNRGWELKWTPDRTPSPRRGHTATIVRNRKYRTLNSVCQFPLYSIASHIFVVQPSRKEPKFT